MFPLRASHKQNKDSINPRTSIRLRNSPHPVNCQCQTRPKQKTQHLSREFSFKVKISQRNSHLFPIKKTCYGSAVVGAMGFEVNRFQGEVDEELICPICSGVLEDPLQVSFFGFMLINCIPVIFASLLCFMKYIKG